MTPSFVTAQILGILVIALFAVAPHMKKKPEMMLCIVIGNLLIVVESLLLGAMTEAAVIAVSLVRSVVFFLYSRREKRAPVWMLIVFMAAQAGGVFLTWKSWFCLLMLFDVGQTYGQWQTDLKILRLSIVLTSVPIGAYNLLVREYMGAVNSLVQLLSAGAALWHRHYRKQKNTPAL
ncbi:MAG: YgjV family protein [Oscillospiraceae bacterium]|nr:YgjV family protein [Oscillospiraceae bacterium]